MYNPFTLENKTIVVTGASSGIGKAIAIECSKMGAKVIISGRNEERLNETLLQMAGAGHSVIVADLSKDDDRKKIVEQSPTLDGLVNCAGLIKTLPFQFIKNADLEEVMSVNFTAPALITADLVKKKKITKGGSIVFISSIAGLYGVTAANSMYAASKCAINGLAKNMALDLADKNIRVNTVNPASVETHIYDEGIFTAEQLEEDKKRYPLKRYGKPEEVAYAVIYLLSDASAWVTGSNLLIDGGYTLN